MKHSTKKSSPSKGRSSHCLTLNRLQPPTGDPIPLVSPTKLQDSEAKIQANLKLFEAILENENAKLAKLTPQQNTEDRREMGRRVGF